MGKEALQAGHTAESISPKLSFEKLRELKIPGVPGTAIFLTRMADTSSLLMVRHFEQIGALQDALKSYFVIVVQRHTALW
jgi:hypothetical protein